ncbi:MAG: adenylyl-sulfate kinase, partial [Actinocatenispora sp.]
MSEWVLPDGALRDAPSYTPRSAELADLELLLSGAYAPLTGFLSEDDIASVLRRGVLADGTSWPVPVTLAVPAEVAERLDPGTEGRRLLVLTDPEGAPVAAVEAAELTEVRGGWFRVAGPVRQVSAPEHGAFRRLRQG